MARNNPNIIFTGTPGVGKTSHCELLAANTGLKHLSVNQIVKERACHDGWDDQFQSWIVDEDKVSWKPVSSKLRNHVYQKLIHTTISCWTLSRMRSLLEAASLIGMRAISFRRDGSTWSSCYGRILQSSMTG